MSYNDYISRSCHTYYGPDPVGLLGTRLSCVHLFDYRKQPSLSFHELPWVPVGWGKQLLIREGGSARPGIKSRATGTRFWFPINEHTGHYLWAVFQTCWNSLRWEKLMIKEGILAHKQVNPRPVGPQVDDADSNLPHHPNRQKNVHEVNLFEQLL